MLPSQDYSNHLYCGKKIQDIWILSKSTFTLRLVSIVLLILPFTARFVLPCTSLQLTQRQHQGNPPDSGLQIWLIQYSSVQVTFFSWGNSIHAHIYPSADPARPSTTDVFHQEAGFMKKGFLKGLLYPSFSQNQSEENTFQLGYHDS